MLKFLRYMIVLGVVAGVLAWAANSERIFPNDSKLKAENQAPPGIRSEKTGILLKECHDQALGIKYLCDYLWEDQNYSSDMIFYAVSTDPAVNFKIVRFDIDILYIQQLSKDKLDSLGQYAKGFVTEEDEVGGLKAVKVKAFAREDDDTRLLDYYFVKDQKLYALLFSVKPKDKWDEYKFDFQRIIDSIHFY